MKRIVFLLLTVQALAAAASQSCGLATRSAKIPGGTVAYNTAGTGPAVMLVHGLFADKEQWSGLACRLAGKGYTVVAADLPGYGGSTGFSLGDYRLEREVENLHALTVYLGLTRLDIAGNSMGGAIAALYAKAYPGQVRSLAFLGSPQGIEGWAAGVKEAIYTGVNPFVPVSQAQLDTELSLLFVTRPQISAAARQGIVARYVAQQGHYIQVWNIVNLYADVLSHAQLPRVPSLIVWGDSDRVFDVAGARDLQQAIPGSRRYELRNAGHLLHVERAGDVAVLYSNFLRDVAAGSAREQPEESVGGADGAPVVAAADFACDSGPDGRQVVRNKGETALLIEDEATTFAGCVSRD